MSASRTASGGRPSRASSAGHRAASSGWPARLPAPLRRHPVGVLAGGTVALAVGAVLWNTLLHQTGRHPAPLFAPPVAPRLARAQPAPLPVPRPDAATVGSLGPPARPEVAKGRPDVIGELIRTGEPPARPAEPPRADPDRVAAAQRALSKLGYGPLKADGVFGATTRQALERFERDRALPVTGTLAGRTWRQLAQNAGGAVE